MTGKLIVFEGVDGCGKSTQVKKAFEYLQSIRVPVISTQEPGGTCLGTTVKEIIKVSPTDCPISPKAEILLFNAARAQLVESLIKPALAVNEVVLADRYYHSTMAYQVFGRQMKLLETYDITSYATDGLRPDLVIVLDVDQPTCIARLQKRDSTDEKRFELQNEQFFNRIRQGYLTLSKTENNITVLDGRLSPEVIFEQVKEELTRIGIH